MNKTPWTSKTLWVMVATLLSTLIPQVQSWLADNPVEFVQALAALGVLLRFITAGKISLSDGDGGNGSGAAGLWVFLAVLPTLPLLGGCTPAGALKWEQFKKSIGPMRVGVVVDDAEISYDSKAGLGVTVDARSGK